VENKIALVTGANKGIGFEICRHLAQKGIQVILTARNKDKGEKAKRKLQNSGLDVVFHQMDVTSENSIQKAADYVREKFGKLNILINNAGIGEDYANSALNTNIDQIKKIIETNTFGPLRVCRAFIPIMLGSNGARIINISSIMGALSEMGSGSVGYRISKTALNAITCILASELKDQNIMVNSMHPGWVRTDMGGPTAPCSVEEGADTAMWLATTCNLPTGRFFQDRKEIEW
jgi:NAD(P)-dependent dehydrogenase (short-subunit alcohol dehydrogenase family)